MSTPATRRHVATFNDSHPGKSGDIDDAPYRGVAVSPSPVASTEDQAHFARWLPRKIKPGCGGDLEPAVVST